MNARACVPAFALAVQVAWADGPMSASTPAVAAFVDITSKSPPTEPSNWGGGAQINASSDQTSGMLKITKSYPDITDDYALFGNGGITISTPVTKTDASTTVPSLDGLTNAYSVQFQYSRFKTFVTSETPERRSARSKICADMRLAAAYAAINEKDKAATATLPCTSASVEKYLGMTTREAYDKASPGPVAGGTVWGGALKVGYENFSYVDSMTAGKNITSKDPWAISAFTSWNPIDAMFLFTAKAEYQAVYKAAAVASLCTAAAGSSSKPCSVGAIGAPTASQKELLSVELRRAFSKMTVALTPVYDFKSKVYGLQLPVYFIPDKSSGILSGGIEVGWQGDTHKLSLGAFASAPLNTLF
jgi:hypothetical protein